MPAPCVGIAVLEEAQSLLWNKYRRIGIVTQPDVVGPVAKVCGRDHPVGAELLIDGEIPLLNVAGTHSWSAELMYTPLLGKNALLAVGKASGKGGTCLALIGIGQASQVAVTRKYRCQRGLLSANRSNRIFRVVIEQAVAGANRLLSFASRVPVEADTRREVGPVAPSRTSTAFVDRCRKNNPGGVFGKTWLTVPAGKSRRDQK